MKRLERKKTVWDQIIEPGDRTGRPGRQSVRRALLTGIFVAAFLPVGCGPTDDPAPERASRVVMIGVDGGSWNLLDPMMAAGELPSLAALAERGVTADLESVQPLNSPTVWTSISTGRSPDVHGVKFFYADRRSVGATTVWERFSAAGLRVGLYEHLVTWPPRDLPGGFMVPGWLRRDGSVRPADLDERLGEARYEYSMEGVDGPEAILTNVQGELAHKAATWNQLMETFDLDAGAVVFYSVDAVSHRFWHAAFPEEFDPPMAAGDPAHADVIHETLRGVDKAIGEVVAGLDEGDHVVIVSDHGFRGRGLRRYWKVELPELFARLEIDEARDGVTAVKNWGGTVFRLELGETETRNATMRRLAEGLETLRDASGQPLFEIQAVHIAEPDPSLEISEFMAQTLEQAQPAHGVVFARPHFRTLQPLWPDGQIQFLGETLPVRQLLVAHDFSGDHERKGIFLAAGSAIRHRPERGELSVLDVAPLLTYLAGQPIPDDLEGRLDTDLLDPAFLAASPPRQIAAAEAPALPPEEGVTGEGEDRELDDRLRSLGYL